MNDTHTRAITDPRVTMFKIDCRLRAPLFRIAQNVRRHQQSSCPGYRLLAGILAAVLVGFPALAGAASQLYPDQENLVQISAAWSSVFLAPIGREFVPEQRTLDAVELTISCTDTS